MTQEKDPKDLPKTVLIDCTNHRGERRVRDILPFDIRFQTSEWHPEPQWLLEAFDYEKNAVRYFALNGLHGWGVKPGPAGQTVDGMLAAQLKRSMELNARMKVRLQKFVDSYSRMAPEKRPEIDIPGVMAAIMRDEDVAWSI